MNFYKIFVVYIIIGSMFNVDVDTEPIFIKPPGGIQFTTKRSILNKETRNHHKHHENRKHYGHQSHRRHMPCMCVTEPNAINPIPVTANSEPSIIIPPVVATTSLPLTTTSLPLTTASTGTPVLFGPRKWKNFEAIELTKQ